MKNKMMMLIFIITANYSWATTVVELKHNGVFVNSVFLVFGSSYEEVIEKLGDCDTKYETDHPIMPMILCYYDKLNITLGFMPSKNEFKPLTFEQILIGIDGREQFDQIYLKYNAAYFKMSENWNSIIYYIKKYNDNFKPYYPDSQWIVLKVENNYVQINIYLKYFTFQSTKFFVLHETDWKVNLWQPDLENEIIAN